MSEFKNGALLGFTFGMYVWLCFAAPTVAVSLAFGLNVVLLLLIMVVWARLYDKNRKRVR